MLRTGRNSVSSGYGPLLATYTHSPRGSPRNSYHSYCKISNKNPKRVFVVQGAALVSVIGLLVLLGTWLELFTSPVPAPGPYNVASAVFSQESINYKHKRSPKADFHNSDLSIRIGAQHVGSQHNTRPGQQRQDSYAGEHPEWQAETQHQDAGSPGNAHNYSQQRPQPVRPQLLRPQPQQQQEQQQQNVQQKQQQADVIAVPRTSEQPQQQAPVVSIPASTATSSAVTQQQTTDAAHRDPLHDYAATAAKEAAQLSALSKVVQQQQDTISRQAKALMDLQKRFVQQERQLQAATATAAASNTSDGVDVEPYFPKERVQQELDMLHKVEAQIDEVSAAAAAASAALPLLTREQQAAQVQQLARADMLMSRLSRVAAAISLRTSDPLTESAHDPVTELRHYYGQVASTNVTLSWQEALRRQHRPTSAELGIDHVEPYKDAELDLETLDVRLEYALAELTEMHRDAPCQISLVATWSGDLWGIRREILPWITYHAQLGVSRVYVLYDGSDQNTYTALLDLHPFVRVILASPPLASRTQVDEFKTWLRTVPDSHIKEWSSQPGNYQLMTKQGFAATKALELARQDNVTWLIHMDPDELLHPGAGPNAGDLGAAFSLLPELCNAPAHVPSIRFVNVEGVPEAADLINRYEQVTLFRAHRHLVQPGAQAYRYIFKQGHADAWLHLYTNGKSAVRPDAPGATQGGPHVFLGPADKRWVTPDNPHGLWKPVISNSTLVLHYAYATPGDVAVKAGRSCPESVVQAVLMGDTAQASKCFVLDIDQRAFMAAIKDRQASGVPLTPPALPTVAPPDDSGPVRELLVDAATLAGLRTSNGFSNVSWPVGKEVLDFFWGELALSEGAPFECLTPDGKAKGWCAMTNVGHLKSLLIGSGLLMRFHTPAQVLKGIEAAIEQLLMVGGRKESAPVVPGSSVPLPIHHQPGEQQQQQPQLSAAVQQQEQGNKQQQDTHAPWEHHHSTVDPVTAAAAAAARNTASAVTAAASTSSTRAAVPAELPKEGSAAANDVRLHNDNAALSKDEHPEKHNRHLSSITSTTSSTAGSNGSSTVGRASSSQGTAASIAASASYDSTAQEAKQVNVSADAVSKDAALAADHEHLKHSAIRDKLLI